MVDAVVPNFPQASHIRCFQQLQQNVEMHLREHQFPQSAIKKLTPMTFLDGLRTTEHIMRVLLIVTTHKHLMQT